MGGMYTRAPAPPEWPPRDPPTDYAKLALEVRCPQCKAAPGHRCRRAPWPHIRINKPHEARQSRAALKHQP